MIDTTSGFLVGKAAGPVIRYSKVPFALPPVGSRRFLRPMPCEAAGELRANVDGAIAPQLQSRLTAVLGDFSEAQSEDCLTLTITTPIEPASDKRPIVIFLHGGAYQACAGSLDWFDGSRLAVEGNLIVVAPNYRLGALGFLAGKNAGDGRQGLDDMILALRWVAENAASLGGDAGAITLMGQSAGAHAIMMMLAMPEVRPLFRRAILMSAPAGLAPLSAKAAAQTGADFQAQLAELGGDLSGPPDLLLQAAAQLAKNRHVLGQIAPVFFPSVDELAQNDAFIEAAAKGAALENIDLLIGTTRDEAHAFFLTDPDHAPPPDIIAKAIRRVDGAYPVEEPGDASLSVLSARVTATMFHDPSLRLARTAAKQGVRVSAYEFAWSPANSVLGACHCIELPFVFGTLDAFAGAPMLAGADPNQMSELVTIIQGAWINFIARGLLPEQGAAVDGKTAITFHSSENETSNVKGR